MSGDPKFDDLKERMVALLEEAYGLGGEAVRQTILAAASMPALHLAAPQPRVPLTSGAIDFTEPKPKKDKIVRAPKGLARKIIMLALEGTKPMSLREVQEMVTFLDDRVPPKTVYNQLRSTPELFVETNGLWSLKQKDSEPPPYGSGSEQRVA